MTTTNGLACAVEDFDAVFIARMREHLAKMGPQPKVRPVHMIEDATWPTGALSLCERGDHAGTRPAPHGWHFYTNEPRKVTCRPCREWMYA